MSRRHQKLINTIVVARDDYAGIGTRKAKLALNRLGKTDVVARALRTALEVEDKNIAAKRYHGHCSAGYSYSYLAYRAKADGIAKLITLSKEHGWRYGIQKSDVPGPSHVIYFHLPGVEQISWHYTPPKPKQLPAYDGVWDGQEASTLRKLEVAIRSLITPPQHELAA